MFVVLVVIAEVVGRSLVRHVDRLLHVQPIASPDASYYPFLLVGVKTVGALVFAGLLARGTRAWATADAGHRLLAACGHEHERGTPRLRTAFSLRVWFGAFAATSVLYLVHADADGIAGRGWPLFAPWLHTYSLPIFAGLAFVVACLWRFATWIYEVEEYAGRTIARVRRILTAVLSPSTRRAHSRAADDAAPRRRFGLSFESRPPPLPA
ncbi:MAG: hypothetical protein QOH16_1122 [Gaiellaceae bacterium]|jgi:hypothetical protein|nr:hypothetical protein [Gaiellaceae bacterium]